MKEKGLTSFQLKIIAIIAMTLDHAAKVLPHIIPSILTYIMPMFGRLTFPIFAFLIAEGCRKTRNMPKYIGRLALFAIISEVFYGLAMTRGVIILSANHILSYMLTFNYKNVFVTLALGAVSIYIFQILKLHKVKWLVWFTVPALIVFMFLASFSKSNYEALGVLLIFACYFFNEKRSQLIVIIIWSIMFYLGWASWGGNGFIWSRSLIIENSIFCVFSCLSVIFLHFYDGKRGISFKWAFYIYYPAHLLLLFVIRYFTL